MTQKGGLDLIAEYESDSDSIATTRRDSLSTLADTQIVDDLTDIIPDTIPDIEQDAQHHGADVDLRSRQ